MVFRSDATLENSFNASCSRLTQYTDPMIIIWFGTRDLTNKKFIELKPDITNVVEKVIRVCTNLKCPCYAFAKLNEGKGHGETIHRFVSIESCASRPNRVPVYT